MQTGSSVVSRAPRPSSLADVLDLILDKGLVIDAYVRVSLAGIEVLTVDARIVVASVDTYLRFAEAVNRLDLGQTEQRGLPGLLADRGSSSTDDGQRQSQRNGNRNGNRDDRQPMLGAPRSRPDAGRSRNAMSNRPARASESDSGPDNSHGPDDTEGGSPGLLNRLADRARFTR